MNETTIGIAGAIATIAAVFFAHYLNQRAGEKRANQVREELIGKIDALDRRITESRDDVKERLQEVKADIRDVRGDVKDLAKELGHTRTEILNALPPRTRSAMSEHRT